MPKHRQHNANSEAAPWVRRFASRISDGGQILDLACGNGRNGRYFLDRGHPVTFVDIETAAVQDMAAHDRAEIIVADLEEPGRWPFADRRFAAILVVNYLWRPIMGDILSALGPGGVLLYETFAVGNEAFGRPRNPDFLLRPGELLEAARARLDIIAYEQRLTDRPAVMQRLAAIRR
ncbi:MAG: class I SAM-dependent methyltransferase [Alphaproteobacteria bacterium]|nr:class I SAM-dependent methyltransferase [Alphaproteobacteria bacterium]